MMELDELQSVRDRERQTDKLQQLRETFYADAGEFIQQLREQRSRAAERADDPFDAPEVSRLSDEIDTAEQTVEAIYEKRVGKIVKAASFAAADLPAESDGLTAEEEELFETLVEDIKSNRQHVLDVLAGEADDDAEEQTAASDGPTPSPAPDEPGPAPSQASGTPPEEVQPDVVADATDDEVSAADVMGATPDTSTPPAESSTTASEPSTTTAEPSEDPPAGDTSTAKDREKRAVPAGSGGTESEPELREDGGTTTGVERETVRITAEVGDIFGVDEREYDLAENDVVTLPSANAEPLVERDAAERL